MGESIVAASSHRKMRETATSDHPLQVSVSFGRFENDALSWEKWSSFSPNKYLEEVEKCATPGSVAQKKAYFEAHYKKIAARKAELLDQEKQIENDSLRSDLQIRGDLIEKSGETDSEHDVFNNQTFTEESGQATKLDGDLGNGYDDEPNENAAIKKEGQDSFSEDVAVNMEGQASAVEGVKEELDGRLDTTLLDKPEESDLVKEEETSSVGYQDIKELPKNLGKRMESISITKKENVKLDNHNESQKITPLTKVRDMAKAKKKPVTPATKVPPISTTKLLKPVSTSTAQSALQSSTKKVNVSLLPRSKNPPVGDSKTVVPKSFHMSLSLETPNSDPAPLTSTRKSFIMEKMSDKDIVKRAFKTFQNNFSQLKSSAEERSSSAKQEPTKGIEVKASTSSTLRKKNGGPLKAGGMDKKTAKLGPSSFGLKSVERAEKRKEFSKKLEEKSNAKEAESTHLRTKSKEEKEADIKKLRQSLNFKATPMPRFYRTQKVSKSPLDKEGSKTLRT